MVGSDVRIDAAELELGQALHAAFSEVVDSRSDDVTFDTAVVGDIEVHRTARTMHLRGRLQTTAPLTCGRCLAAFRADLAAIVNEEFLIGEPAASGPGALEPGDVVGALGPLVLDVTEVVRQHLLLALPMVPVCTPGCRGLCPRCGTNLNERDCGHAAADIDPRLAPLRILKDIGKLEEE